MADADANIAPFPSPAKGRVKDPTAALRQRRHRKRKSLRNMTAAVTGTVTAPRDQPVTALPTAPMHRQNKRFRKTNDFNGDVTVATVTDGNANQPKSVTPFAQPQCQENGGPVTFPERRSGVAEYAASIALALVGVNLSAVGMVETATYSVAVGGVLFCVLAVSADVLTLAMPSIIGALWRRRSPAIVLAGALWCAGAAVTVANLAGYVGEHVEQYQAGRETLATGRNLIMERLARLQDERKGIVEMRPPGVIAAALNDARRSERPALREALALAKRRDALDIELAAFEQRLGDIPQVATTDAAASVLSDISGTTVSEHQLRRMRLALLLGLPLCGGLVLSVATALTAAASVRRSTV